MQPAMTFSEKSAASKVKLLPPTDAHFARLVREAEDLRHARMLHSILHRPAVQAVGHFKEAERHEFFSRTLAMRKRNARVYKEFSRQKENLLLLQRLQQIHFYEHPMYSRNRGGKNYAKEWEVHQAKHDAARARLATRPRVGSSLIFSQTVRSSPLSPRHRREWEGKQRGEWRDTTHLRDSELLAEMEREGKLRSQQKRLAQSSTRSSVGKSSSSQYFSSSASNDRASYSQERASIEAELQRRWAALPDDPSDTDPHQDLTELELGPDMEDENLAQWTQSNAGGIVDPFAPGKAASSSLLHFPVAPLAVHAPVPPAPDTHRRNAMRARYIADDEEEVDFGAEEEGASTSTGSRDTSSSLRTSLYALATHPSFSGDDAVERYRLAQYSAAVPMEGSRRQEQSSSFHDGARLSSSDGVRPASYPLPPPPPPPAPSHLLSPHSREIDDVLAVLADFEDLEGSGQEHGASTRSREIREARRGFYAQTDLRPAYSSYGGSSASTRSEQSLSKSSSRSMVHARSPSTSSNAQSSYAAAPPKSQNHARSASASRSRPEEKEPTRNAEAEADEYLRSLAKKFGGPVQPSSSSKSGFKQPQRLPSNFMRETYATKHYAEETVAGFRVPPKKKPPSTRPR